MVQISKPGAGRKAYWIDATIHAREWISTATAVKIINHVNIFLYHFTAIIVVISEDWWRMTSREVVVELLSGYNPGQVVHTRIYKHGPLSVTKQIEPVSRPSSVEWWLERRTCGREVASPGCLVR